jgi:diguanylate cyclase (GGDEF)-like protein/PAS domain S-box-containing protein
MSNDLILVADDDRAGRLLVRATLEQLGFQVVEAATGSEAVRAFAEHRPVLAVLDVLMPDLNGFDACIAIRAAPDGASIPILMLTGLEDVASIQRAFEAGATDFAVKPLNWIVLGQRVRYMLRAQETLDALRRSQGRLAQAQRIARLGYWERDLSTRTVEWTEETRALFGVSLLDRTWTDAAFMQLIHPDDRESVREALRGLQQGEPYCVEFRVPTPDGLRFLHEEGEALTGPPAAPIPRMAGITQDITWRKDAEQQIHFLAHYDALTQLPNRTLFLEHLRIAMATARRRERMLAIAVIGLDAVRQVTDALGASAGDRLLKEAAHRLRTNCRQSDLLARGSRLEAPLVSRSGAHEFIVSLGDIEREADAARIAQRLLDALREPFAIGQRPLVLTGTIGISLFPEDGDTEEGLIAHATLAMHHAQEAGRNTYQFYASAMNHAVQHRLMLESELREALTRGELFLQFQPQVALQSGTLVGAEALLRWKHPDLGLVSPAQFIPLAEESDLIVHIGEWVLREACTQYAAWQTACRHPLRVAVNVSGRHVLQGSLVDTVEQVLADTGITPACLELEVTESVLIREPEQVVQTLKRLKALGVRLALDDFGTGYSSLGYLARFPLDVLKVDRSFIQQVTSDATAAAITKAILALARSLGLGLIAEGIETPDQLRFLLDHGCEIGQGYLLGRPGGPRELLDSQSGSHLTIARQPARR